MLKSAIYPIEDAVCTKQTEHPREGLWMRTG